MSPPKLGDTAYDNEKGQPPKSGGALSDEQFARIEELLLPGYEISKLMLEDYKRQQEGRAAYEASQQPKTGSASTDPAPVG